MSKLQRQINELKVQAFDALRRRGEAMQLSQSLEQDIAALNQQIHELEAKAKLKELK